MFKKVRSKTLIICICAFLIFAQSAMAFEGNLEIHSDNGSENLVTVKESNLALIERIEVDPELDEVDVILAAIMYLSSMDIVLDYSNTTIIPLYDSSGSVIAYHVSFSSNAYAVINNYRGNPSAIEFGLGENEKIREIYDASSSTNIIYNNPISVLDSNEIAGRRDAMLSIPSFCDIYPELQDTNAVTASLHNEMRKDYENKLAENRTRGDGDYGFVTAPSGTWTGRTITSASSVTWAVMSSFNDIANNHCGATLVTNLALYFHQRGHSNLRITDIRNTFAAVHKIVGNGPQAVVAGDAVKYFSDRGYKLNHSDVSSISAVKTALSSTNNRPLGTLLADGLANWHWVLTVGYREYTNGDFYMQIVTGWRNGIDRYYKPGTGSVWWSSTQYWVS